MNNNRLKFKKLKINIALMKLFKIQKLYKMKRTININFKIILSKIKISNIGKQIKAFNKNLIKM